MFQQNDTPMNTSEVALYLRRSPAQIRQMVAREQIPFRKICGRLLFLKSEIDGWIDSQPGVSLESLQKSFEIGDREEQ